MKPKSIQLEIKFSRWKQDLRDQRGLEMTDNRFVAYERYGSWGIRRTRYVFRQAGCSHRLWAGTCKHFFSRRCRGKTRTVCQTRW